MAKVHVTAKQYLALTRQAGKKTATSDGRTSHKLLRCVACKRPRYGTLYWRRFGTHGPGLYCKDHEQAAAEVDAARKEERS